MNKLKGIIAGFVIAAVVASSAIAATVISVEKIVKGGLQAAQTSMLATITYTFRNNGRTLLHFEKTGVAGTSTVTITTTATVGGLAVADQTFTVNETDGDRFAGPFPPALFNDGQGDVSFTVTNTGTIVVEILSL